MDQVLEQDINSAQTNDALTGATGSDAVSSQSVQQQEYEVNDAEFTDTSIDGQSSEQKSDGQPAAKKQNTSEENSANARRRREAEQKKAIEAAKVEAVIETLGGKNPYTGEPMKDATDVAEYRLMKEIEANGGDPLADYSKFAKDKIRQREQTAREQAEKAKWFEEDKRNFVAKYPNVNFDELTKDVSFNQYAIGKVGVMPLTDIYEGYQRIVSKFTDGAKKQAAQMVANAKATPGSLTSTDVGDTSFYTKEQVEKMSKDEIKRNLTKVKASMAKW